MSLGRQIRCARLNQYQNRQAVARKADIDIDRFREIEAESVVPTKDECIAIANTLCIPAFILTTEHTYKTKINPHVPFVKACSSIQNPTKTDIDNCLETYAAHWCNTRITSHNANFQSFFGFKFNECYELINEMRTVHSIIDEHIGRRATSLPSIPDNFAYLMVDKHGSDYQDLMLMEDCFKLEQEICNNRHSHDPTNLNNRDELVAKMANLLVDIQISMHAHGITHDDIKTAIKHRVRECCAKSEIMI